MEQVIEEKIQLILPIILRNVGPLLLRGGLGGLSGGGAATNPNDDDDDDDDFNDGNSNTSVKEGDDGRKVSISLPTFPPDVDDEDEDEDEDETSVSTNEESEQSGQSDAKNNTELPTRDENNTITKTDKETNVSNSDSKNETNKSQITTPSTVVNTTPSTSPPLIRTPEPTTTTSTPFIPTTFHPNNSPSSTVNDESLLYSTEQSTNQNNDNDDETITQTTEYYDFSGCIDIRSDFQDDDNIKNQEPSTDNIVNIPTTTISYSGADPNNHMLQFAFRSGIDTTDSTENETKNLVRRRRKTVITRRHRLH